MNTAQNKVSKAEIIKKSEKGIRRMPDLVAVEEPLEIRMGFGRPAERDQKNISVTMRTPGHDFDLAIGFLFTENIISGYDDVVSIHYCEDAGKQHENNVVRVELSPQVEVDIQKFTRNFYTSSSCGVCGKGSIEAVQVHCMVITSDFRVAETAIIEATEKLRQAQHVFEYTGGLHAAGLFDNDGALISMREDVGRHNALDKLIGASLLDNRTMSNNFVLVSGRASFELVQKAAVAGIPVLAAVGAPSSLAVALAKDVKMTLVGFVRNGGFNIYCGEERIMLTNENQN